MKVLAVTRYVPKHPVQVVHPGKDGSFPDSYLFPSAFFVEISLKKRPKVFQPRRRGSWPRFVNVPFNCWGQRKKKHRCGSKILVRGVPAKFWPQGGPWPQNLLKNSGSSLKFAWKLHDLKKNLGYKGGPGPQAPLDPPLKHLVRVGEGFSSLLTKWTWTEPPNDQIGISAV